MSIESFVFNVAEKVLEKVASTAYDEICFAWGLEGELKKLEDILSTVKAVLLDAEEKQATNRELRVWLAKLKEALYDAEDVLDEFECETKRRQVLKLYGITTKKRREKEREEGVILERNNLLVDLFGSGVVGFERCDNKEQGFWGCNSTEGAFVSLPTHCTSKID
ncbi:hypothetical protein JCGZ_21079 [Jatropha curcas]|uniref:Disease resistance N-terminal domain-containing protein n=1 Tax=Jatropha curcas TaxID=180498 RepID=A0A067JQ09_JATCU|nr:hypothetical protein JCGZ_21079 [Jatropha curcas]